MLKQGESWASLEGWPCFLQEQHLLLGVYSPAPWLGSLCGVYSMRLSEFATRIEAQVHGGVMAGPPYLTSPARVFGLALDRLLLLGFLSRGLSWGS